MVSKEEMKQMISFMGVSASEKNITLAFSDREDVIVAQKVEETAPWITASGHDYSEFIDPIIDENLNGKTYSPQEAKEEVAKKLIDAMIREIRPLIHQTLKEAKEVLMEMEQIPVIKIQLERKTDKTDALLHGQIKPLLAAPIMEYFTEEAKTLKSIEKYIETDYPEHFQTTLKYVKIMLDLNQKLESDTGATSAEGREKIQTFKSNCELFRDYITFREVRQLKPEPSETEINKHLFDSRYDTVEELVAKLA